MFIVERHIFMLGFKKKESGNKKGHTIKEIHDFFLFKSFKLI